MDSASTLVSDWFGPRFSALHPLLQQLHLRGGRLAGEVELGFGPGLAGWLGRRLAQRMGLPLQAGITPLEVHISHTDAALVWSRRFGVAQQEAVSSFEPIGRWPDGVWRESTGAMRFVLTVDVRDGGWHWRVLAARLHGLPIQVALLPRSHAGKWIADGAYRFEVMFDAPLLGPLFWYRGSLHLQARGPLTAVSWPADSRHPEIDAGGIAA